MVNILGANSVSGGYEIDNSLRFNDGDSAKLGLAFGSGGNTKTWTVSCWFKRGIISSRQSFLNVGSSGSEYMSLYIDSDDKLYWVTESGGNLYRIGSSALFRDPSAWYHIVFRQDTTDGTANNRFRYYINGAEVDTGAFNAQPTQNFDGKIGGNDTHYIGSNRDGNGEFMDGYLTEYHYLDGISYDPTYFGEFDDNGVWIPKKYTGSYGTKGFYLEFKQTGTSQNSSGIGADTSGNDNHWAVTNLAAIDVMPDTPTNNFATMNPLDAGSQVLLSDGNLGVNWNGVTGHSVNSTIAVSKGKWYVEMRRSQVLMSIGLIRANQTGVGASWVGATVYGAGGSYAYVPTGNKRTNGSDDSYGDAFAHGDRLGIAFDADNGALYFYKNGTIQNSGTAAFTGISGTYHFSLGYYGGTNTTGNDNIAHVNFGGDGTFGQTEGATQKTNADANGYGHFYYAVPSGYYSLCTKNLAEFG